MPTVPQINLNGTDGEELLAQNSKVLARLQHALLAISDAFPNGRDFQTCRDPNTHKAARREAEERGIALGKLIRDYEEIVENLREQLDARKR